MPIEDFFGDAFKPEVDITYDVLAKEGGPVLNLDSSECIRLGAKIDAAIVATSIEHHCIGIVSVLCIKHHTEIPFYTVLIGRRTGLIASKDKLISGLQTFLQEVGLKPEIKIAPTYLADVIRGYQASA
jgi:hypothetical protein